MAVERRRDAAGGGPGRQPAPAEENGALPPGDAAASALGGRAGGGDIQPAPHPSCCAAPGAPSLLLLDYDGSVLPFLGGLGGGYQRTLVLLTWIPALFIGFSQFSDSFLLDQPNFWCRGAGQGSEPPGLAGPGRWGAGDLANWTGAATATPFSTAAWGTAGDRSNGSGGGGPDTKPLSSPAPPDKGDNASNCHCHAWDYGIRTGLVQNVVTKMGSQERRLQGRAGTRVVFVSAKGATRPTSAPSAQARGGRAAKVQRAVPAPLGHMVPVARERP